MCIICGMTEFIVTSNSQIILGFNYNRTRCNLEGTVIKIEHVGIVYYNTYKSINRE